ncbi:MAG: DVUA0089 family protein [Cyanobacteria bacterium P01_F01_bin.143]
MTQVSLFSGPDYLIESEGTVSAHAFNVTDGVIPEDGLVVSVDAPNLNEFDLQGVSVVGGQIETVRDGGFDLRILEYTALVNLPILDDGEAEQVETATFSLAPGEGYDIVTDYSGGSFGIVDSRADIPLGEVDTLNNIIPLATGTNISPENPNFSGNASIYFDIGNRYLNEDGTYTYIDYSEDVDLYRVDLNAGDTIAIETFDMVGNPNPFGFGLDTNLMIFDADGNRARDFVTVGVPDAPDKLFGGIDPFDPNTTDTYNEFTAPQDGAYYIALGGNGNLSAFASQLEFNQPIYDPFVPGSGNGDGPHFGNYRIEIDLITEDNPLNTGTPTPPVSNPGVTVPPTLSLSASPLTTDAEGNVTPAVVEFVELDGVSDVTFTIQAEGEIPEGGLEFVLNSNVNLFDYISFLAQESLPGTIGGQLLGAFYNEDGLPTGFRLLIEEPVMTLNYQTANNPSFLPDFLGNVVGEFEPLETDGPEDVTFFVQPGEGYEVDPDEGTVDVTYYDSLEDVPPPNVGGDTGPEVGVTISETFLIESEGTETILTFTLSEAPPSEGITIFLDSDQDPLVGSALSQFAVLEAEVEGGDFPIANGDRSGFFFNITEQTASITLPVFDELTVPGINPFAVQEGLLELDFVLQSQPGYTVDSDASEINLTIADNPSSQIQVTLTNLSEFGEASPPLIESEGTVSVHTFNVSAAVPAEGLTVSVSAPNLNDFNLDAIEVLGGSIAAVRTDGFDLTITEPTATINLPVLDDGITEGSETATFILEPGDNYETNQELVEAVFILSDTITEVSVPEEIEGNDTIADANALGLTAENPSVSLSGSVNRGFTEPGEDVDFFSFELEAGQTILLDIDSSEWNVVEEAGSVIFPALDGVQLPDTELRLFDAVGNELAANNDGAAPGEEFSRDPFIEYIATEAGTYYVGVSQLGNRNYDPNVERSGSGWTFPEVGIFYGPYELTASLADNTTLDLLDTPINRFQNSEVPGTYLYATEAESISIRSDFPNLIEEGVAFSAAIEPDDELIVLNRFQNSDLPGTYLYAGEEESQSIRANFSNYIEEGIAFYAYGVGAGEETPFIRFQNSDVPGTYLYATGAEADNIRANFPNFIEEGIAFEAKV